jgi:hypothetical protein
MLGHGGRRILPSALDGLAARFAPAWPVRALDAGAATGRGLQLLRPLLWFLVAAAIAQSVLHIADLTVLDVDRGLFSADEDESVVGWLGTITTGLTAWAALLLVLLAPRARTGLLVLAALCGYLSLDDMLQLHEIVAHLALRNPLFAHSGYDLWTAVYLPMLCVLGWLMLRTARSIDVRAGRLVVVGLAALATAVVLEALVPVLFALGSDHGQPLYETEVVIEEALELLGWGLMAIGLTAAVLDLVPTLGSRPAALGEGDLAHDED